MTASLLVTAVVAFVGTTVDDVVILTALFVARSRSGVPTARSIVAGQYAGFAALLAVSLAAATGLRIVPDRWVGLLGLGPFGFGVWGLWRLRGSDDDSPPPLASTASRIAAITFANGADNISVFTPLFRTFHGPGPPLVTGLFLLLVGAVRRGRAAGNAPRARRDPRPGQPLAGAGGVHRRRCARPGEYRHRARTAVTRRSDAAAPKTTTRSAHASRGMMVAWRPARLRAVIRGARPAVVGVAGC